MKPLTFSVLRHLNDGEFHSGEAIARQLGTTRASVSNALAGLDEMGLVVHKVHGRGYRLPDPIHWLEINKIAPHLSRAAKNLRLKIVDTTTSTNDQLLQGASRDTPGGSVVVAEYQSAGRGRRGREWHSGLGGALTFSLLWRFDRGVADLSGLSLAVSIAVVRALSDLGIAGVTLKWPNDVLFEHRKLAGILIESQGDVLGPTLAVIGIGVNLKLAESVRTHIDQGATDVFSITPELPERNKLLAVLLSELVAVLTEFEREGFGGFRKDWSRYHAFENKPVTLRLSSGISVRGVVCGIADDGALLLQTAEGNQRFSSGEISLVRHL